MKHTDKHTFQPFAETEKKILFTFSGMDDSLEYVMIWEIFLGYSVAGLADGWCGA